MRRSGVTPEDFDQEEDDDGSQDDPRRAARGPQLDQIETLVAAGCRGVGRPALVGRCRPVPRVPADNDLLNRFLQLGARAELRYRFSRDLHRLTGARIATGTRRAF